MINYTVTGFADEIHPNMNEQYKVLKKLGIKHIEVRGVNGTNISKLTSEQVKELKKELDENGISISAIGSPIGKIKITEDFEPHFEVFKKTVEFAKILDTKYIRMFSFYAEGNESEKPEVFSRLKKMIDYAKEQDIVLLHENEKGIYGATAEHCYEIMKELYCENFKAIFDFANFVQCDCDTLKAYSLLEPYIEYFHIKDALFENHEVVPAGKGDGNVEAILKTAFKNGFNGFLSLEPHLTHFIGLDGLETEKISEKPLKNGEDAYTLAYNSLKNILENI